MHIITMEIIKYKNSLKKNLIKNKIDIPKFIIEKEFFNKFDIIFLTKDDFFFFCAVNDK